MSTCSIVVFDSDKPLPVSWEAAIDSCADDLAKAIDKHILEQLTKEKR